MFGSSTNGNAPAGGTPSRPAAADVARIEGNLTHILVGDEAAADGVNVFVNAKPIPVGEIESLSIEIVAPSDNAPDGTLTALLSRYVDSGTGQRQQATVALFPGTVEVIARGRRLTVTCQQPGSFDGLWLGLGMRADGTSAELTGVQSLRVVVAPASKLLDARLIWADTGATEDLLG